MLSGLDGPESVAILERRSIMDNMFILKDRLQKIRQIINKYGEDNFYISF